MVDPNLQNIPMRTREGLHIREPFVPEPGHLVLSADYSQIELRALAHQHVGPGLGPRPRQEGLFSLHPELAHRQLGLRLILQIHDELWLKAPEAERARTPALW